MSILSAFTTEKPTMTLAEVAEETGLHKSTILRLTNSMAIFGFIQRDEAGRFSVGPSVWRLGLIFRRDFARREHVAPSLKILSEATGETASFYVRNGNERICLYRENFFIILSTRTYFIRFAFFIVKDEANIYIYI